MAKNKKRLDEYLVGKAYFDSAEQVKRSCIAKEIRVGSKYITSCATLIELDDNNIPKAEIFIKGNKQFVSRGGLKIAKALDKYNLDVFGKKCLDIGSSTGGFTDCLLQAGAGGVTCVDVNYGQLAWSIRNNPKVKVFERLNIRNADPKQIGAPFDIIVTDVSFISLALLSNKIASFCKPSSVFVGLIKPQFECKKDETVNGVAVDDNVRQRTIEEVSSSYKSCGFLIKDICESPIKGPAGNTEYLMYSVFEQQ